jgi:3-oxoacyl-[acyl-carrier-protein] synthase II
MNRVVVTGMGVTSPVGSDRGEFWRGLTGGRSGIGPITLFDAGTLPVRIGGEVKSLALDRLHQRFPAASDLRDRKVWLGLQAAEEALASSGVRAEDFETALLHVGVSLEVFNLEDVTPVAYAKDLGRALSTRVVTERACREIQVPLDRLAELIGGRYGFLGGRFTNCSACAAGAQAIGEAFQALREGAVEVALAGAADSMLNPLGLGGFSLLHVLSAENDRPHSACRPFDRTRVGTVLGEGAAFLLLETLDHVRRRGARVHAEVLGYGSSLDAYRVSDPAPDGHGAILSMRMALRDAGLGPEDVDCVNAHGTGTPKNDAVETAAIKEVLGGRAREVPVHAVKSMTGHLIAASGATEAVAAVLTLEEGTVPPTINLACPDPECDLDYVPGAPRPFAGRVVLSNSFGFGGQNATLLFGRSGEP